MSSYTATILPPSEDRGLPRWAIAALVVLALHLAIGLWFIATRHPELPEGTPTDAVMIDLAPVAAAPSQPVAAPPQETAAPPQESPQVQPDLTTPEPPPQVTPPPPQPPVQTAPETPPEVTTPSPVPPISQMEPLPDVQAPEPEAVIPPPMPAPQKTLEQKNRDAQKRLEKARKEKALAQHRKEHAERLAKERAERAASARASQAGHRGVPHGSMSTWIRELQARVNAAAPSAAMAGGESGSATLAFTVDAGGRIVSASIARSSGAARLDQATLSMARRIGRLPPPPNGRVSVRVPVRFK